MDSERLMFVTGSKTFEIDYSIARRVSNKNVIQSEQFTVGGYDWVIEVYPHGISETVSDHVSVFVKLLNTTKEVQAMYTFRLLDWGYNKWCIPRPSRGLSSDLITFSPLDGKTSVGSSTYIKRSDVLNNPYYLKDDMLAIKCTLWVQCDGHHLQHQL